MLLLCFFSLRPLHLLCVCVTEAALIAGRIYNDVSNAKEESASVCCNEIPASEKEKKKDSAFRKWNKAAGNPLGELLHGLDFGNSAIPFD